MVVNIRLSDRRELTALETEQDSLNRLWVGYDPTATSQENWDNNRGRYVVSEKRLHDQHYVTFSRRGAVVAVAERHNHERVSDPGPRSEKIAFIGRPLAPGDTAYDHLIGMSVPSAGQNPVQYIAIEPPNGTGGAPVLAEGNTVLLTWNPAHSDFYADGTEPGPENWSTGGRRSGISPGDRVFMLRQGVGARGLVASGYATSEIYSGAHWETRSKTANYVKVQWDTILDEPEVLAIETLSAAIPGQHWTPQSSGTFIKPELVGHLEDLWRDFSTSGVGEPPPRGGAGRQNDPVRRKKVEDAAQQRLMTYYYDRKWDVVDTHLNSPYDAVATKGRKVLYLEAKGTEGSGAVVRVTRNEVDHARENPTTTFIGIWSDICFGDDDEVDQQSGTFTVQPFAPKKSELKVVDYEWRPSKPQK
ncbi:hypothetical protein HQ314_06460 [Rhodococcus sp. BP-332]|uniref:protein NO VEIN domain-containing protein n=1 Tax=Rhodococcus sp. BP-332 TaxID=2739447 RepID=UPI001C9B7A67|nr:DUF3883 domain-containing protein [Rhodococcus sp. BP-332]MBY6676552.1 hypothetical protein [Rhodococcus sp. BP-332]